MKKRTLALMAAGVMLFGVTTGGTLAWLMDSSEKVTNTFTVGDIGITLDEAKVNEDGVFMNGTTEVDTLAEAERVYSNKYQAIPGKIYSKDPTLTIAAGSETCYVFVEFNEFDNPATYYTYDFALDGTANDTYTNWSKGDGIKIPKNVWYTTVNESPDATTFKLLNNNKLEVKDSVTKENMATASKAKLEWKAYAIQRSGSNGAEFTAEEAWDIVNPKTT